jgi:hypothetical protein
MSLLLPGTAAPLSATSACCPSSAPACFRWGWADADSRASAAFKLTTLQSHTSGSGASSAAAPSAAVLLLLTLLLLLLLLVVVVAPWPTAEALAPPVHKRKEQKRRQGGAEWCQQGCNDVNDCGSVAPRRSSGTACKRMRARQGGKEAQHSYNGVSRVHSS